MFILNYHFFFFRLHTLIIKISNVIPFIFTWKFVVFTRTFDTPQKKNKVINPQSYYKNFKQRIFLKRKLIQLIVVLFLRCHLTKMKIDDRDFSRHQEHEKHNKKLHIESAVQTDIVSII